MLQCVYGCSVCVLQCVCGSSGVCRGAVVCVTVVCVAVCVGVQWCVQGYSGGVIVLVNSGIQMGGRWR